MLQALIGPVSSLLEKFIPDKDLRSKLSHEIATMAEKNAHEQIKAQLEINKTEAQHNSLFVSGWRPAVGWTCCLGMAANFLIIPMTNFALALASSNITIPLIDLETMLPVLLGMLGLGGMRSYEKSKGVARK
ncbi:holin family protein [bacterium]|nr:holin family protein [bacterium]|tara:strand:+ start:717 stop:1112 length:396 start_codon:yes stop_codon:yes gene_type:complete